MLKIPAPPIGLIFFLILIYTIPCFSQGNRSTAQQLPKTWGIFIGVDQTQEGIGNRYAARSASEFHSLWVQHQNADPGSSMLLLNQNAHEAAFRDALQRIRTAQSQDRVVVYISTPTFVRFTGAQSASGYLVPHDGSLTADSRPSQLIAAQELKDAVMASPANEILVFIDAPLSGLNATSWPPPIAASNLASPSASQGKHVLVAGRWGDTFFQTPEGQSPFTASIQTALRTQAADSNKDTYVSFSELGTFVRSRVAEYSNGYQYVQVRSYEGSQDVSIPLHGSLPGGPSTNATGSSLFQPTDSLTLVFESTPSTAQVFVDNRYVGDTPLQLSAAQWKDISVVVQQEGHPPWTQVLTPDRASDSQMMVRLNEDRAMLHFAGVPSQNEIWINGMREPMAGVEPLQLAAGNYEVIIRDGSKRIVNQQLLLEPGTNHRLTFDSKFSVGPALASLVVPGLGQFNNDARVKGIGFAAATFSALALSYVNNRQFLDSRDLFFEAQNNYNSARTPVQAGLFREEMLSQYDNLIDYDDRRKNMLFIAAAIQGLSVIDALIFHSRKSVLRYEQKDGLTPFLNARHEGVAMGLRIGL